MSSTTANLPRKRIGNSIAMRTACIDCTNQRCLLKRNLNSDVVSKFTHKKAEILCKKGQQFIMEGAPVNGLFFVLFGTCLLYTSPSPRD